MSHHSRPKLLARVVRMRGQVEAIERALDGEAPCQEVMHMVAGVRGAMNGLMAELVEQHVRSFLVAPAMDPTGAEAAEQFIEVVHTYLK